MINAVDSVTFEIVLNKLSQITEEMGINYVNTSGSAVIVEANDMNTCIVTRKGDTVALGPFLRKLAPTFGMIVKNITKQGIKIDPGDVIICNDPYLGVLHQPDFTTLIPIFSDGELVFWVATSGHQVDIGGMDPGGFSIRAVDVHQEGIRMPLVKIVEAGRFKDDIFNWIMNQVRDRTVGLDIKAQLAANKIGEDRVKELIDRYGKDVLMRICEESIAFSESKIRSRLSLFPDGSWSEIQYIDPDGKSGQKYKVICKMTKRGDRLTFDFTGTSPQARAGINCTASGLWGGVLTSLLVMLSYDLPWNQGVFNSIDIVAPEGSIVNATYPAPCSGATIISSWVVDNLATTLLSRMFACNEEYHDEQMSTWCGSIQYPAIAGINSRGRRFSMAEMSHHAGAGGARAFKDGVDTGGVHSNSTPSIPNIEFNESHHPVLYLFRRHLKDSGGPGKFRGGASAEFALIAYDCPEEGLESVSVGNEFPGAKGLSGGLPGGIGSSIAFDDTDIPKRMEQGLDLPVVFDQIVGDIKILPSSYPRMPFTKNQVLYSNWQGAGGFGDPIERDPDLVIKDLLDGLVSMEASYAIYGVVTNETDKKKRVLDREATLNRRLEIRKNRIGKEPEQKLLTRDDWAKKGPLWISESLFIDRTNRGIVCGRCGYRICSSNENYKDHVVSITKKLGEIDFAKGKLCDRGNFVVLLFCCPRCATQLDVDVVPSNDQKPIWDTQVE
ncbi:MAG: hydantoinase B/oxoprolinase family protein [Thaumarchaeota archaeon]|nr:hydantoinase B/oxoprolinase family protein [Nitrososphaerota archaeon]